MTQEEFNHIVSSQEPISGAELIRRINRIVRIEASKSNPFGFRSVDEDVDTVESGRGVFKLNHDGSYHILSKPNSAAIRRQDITFGACGNYLIVNYNRRGGNSVLRIRE